MVTIAINGTHLSSSTFKTCGCNNEHLIKDLASWDKPTFLPSCFFLTVAYIFLWERRNVHFHFKAFLLLSNTYRFWLVLHFCVPKHRREWYDTIKYDNNTRADLINISPGKGGLEVGVCRCSVWVAPTAATCQNEGRITTHTTCNWLLQQLGIYPMTDTTAMRCSLSLVLMSML